MKKPKRLKKPNVPAAVKRSLSRAKAPEEKVAEALSNVPRITNETVTEHREEVLKGARKHIYPLQHSKKSVVRISLSLLLAALVGFFIICGLSLYKFQNTSGFMYDVTRIIPFPVAKVGDKWVSYESYLFELRRNMHYYQTQQQAEFKSKDGKAQLKRLKEQAMDQVVSDAYVKQLASKNHVSVSGAEVSNELSLVRSQNRLGTNNRVFREVLKEFWGWSEADFRRELMQQMLQQAVVAKLDTQANTRAQRALSQLSHGADFAKLAAKISDDLATKGNGGEYPRPITSNDREVPPAITSELFKLKPKQISDILNTGYTLEILKVNDSRGGKVRASHIQFTLVDISTYTKPLETKTPPHKYIKF